MWNTGIFMRFAITAEMQLFVSPSTRKASGFSSRSTSSVFVRIDPSAAPSDEVSALRK